MEIYEFLETSTKLDLAWLGLQIRAIISDNEEKLLYLLREQWEAGKNEDGKPVGYYKPVTENFYAVLDPPSSGLPKRAGSPYNLIWGGSLFRGLSIDFEFGGGDDLFLLIDSKASTKDPLFRRIRSEGLVADPESIFGFQEVNLGKIRELTNEGVINKFYEFLNI